MENKTCTTCQILKPLNEFSRNSRIKSGYTSKCKLCTRIAHQRWRETPEAKEKRARVLDRFHQKHPQYAKERYHSSFGAINEKNKVRYHKNKEKITEQRKFRRKFLKANGLTPQRKRSEAYAKWMKEYLKEYRKSYVLCNKHRLAQKAAKRRAALRKATPPWLDAELSADIEVFYFVANLWSNGESQYHVDHIIPLCGRGVCGLHVPWNLRVINKELNLRKSNKFIETMGTYSPSLIGGT